jgi:hypothetical protein
VASAAKLTQDLQNAVCENFLMPLGLQWIGFRVPEIVIITYHKLSSKFGASNFQASKVEISCGYGTKDLDL